MASRPAEHGGWTQDVPLEQSDIAGPVSVTKTGPGSKALRQAEDIAVRSTMLPVDHVDIRNAPLVFVGYGVKAPEKQWDDFKGGLHMDGGSINGRTKDVTIRGLGKISLQEDLAAAAKNQDRFFTPDPMPETGRVLPVGQFQFCEGGGAGNFV